VLQCHKQRCAFPPFQGFFVGATASAIVNLVNFVQKQLSQFLHFCIRSLKVYAGSRQRALRKEKTFFHVSVPNIYGTSSSTYLIIFLKVISKVLFFNITQKFTNLLVQLSIFLIDLFVGTYRLSSHARLEAFVIQTKLNY